MYFSSSICRAGIIKINKNNIPFSTTVTENLFSWVGYAKTFDFETSPNLELCWKAFHLNVTSVTKKGGELVEFITDDKRNVGCDLLLRERWKEIIVSF